MPHDLENEIEIAMFSIDYRYWKDGGDVVIKVTRQQVTNKGIFVSKVFIESVFDVSESST